MTAAPAQVWIGRAIGDPGAVALTGLSVPAAAGHPDHGAWVHFRTRVLERVGQHADPEAIWCALIAAIRTDRRDLVRCLGRLTRKGRRVWQFRVADGRTFFAVYDHYHDVPVTVLTLQQLEDGRAKSVKRLSGRAVP